MQRRRIATLVLAILLCGVTLAQRATTTTQPAAPIAHRHEQRREPDISLHVVTIDLSDSTVSLHVAPAGDDPDGPGEWQTTLAPVSATAKRSGFDLAINGSFFEIGRAATQPVATTLPSATSPATQGAQYVAGAWAKNVGLHASEGRVDSPTPRDGWPILWIEGARRVRIGTADALPAGARGVMGAVSGSNFILRDGKRADFSSKLMPARHPRTAVGINRDGTKLFILVVDGRRPGVSIGMTGEDLAAEFERLGAHDAINLDGGGSSTLVMRDTTTGELRVVNQPSDGRERNVADAIGVVVKSH